MADPVLTERLRAGIGGRAWRCYEITHTGESTCTVTAASMALDMIECIVGVNTVVPVQAAPGSVLCGMGMSISADRDALVWASTVACTQTVTVIGW